MSHGRPRPAADAVAEPDPRRRLLLRRPRPPAPAHRAGAAQRLARPGPLGAWSLEEHTATSVSLVYRLMAQTGYPWTLDLHVLYDLSARRADRHPDRDQPGRHPAPYASGAHPYLCVGPARSTAWS